MKKPKFCSGKSSGLLPRLRCARNKLTAAQRRRRRSQSLVKRFCGPATLCSAISLNHARLSAAAHSFAALKTAPRTQARARAAGACCSRCRCRCGDVGLQCCSSTRGSAGRSILLAGNLEHCSSQRSSRRFCSHIAAECRSRDLRWWRWCESPCRLSYVCLIVLCWLGNRMVECYCGRGLLC